MLTSFHLPMLTNTIDFRHWEKDISPLAKIIRLTLKSTWFCFSNKQRVYHVQSSYFIWYTVYYHRSCGHMQKTSKFNIRDSYLIHLLKNGGNLENFQYLWAKIQLVTYVFLRFLIKHFINNLKYVSFTWLEENCLIIDSE